MTIAADPSSRRYCVINGDGFVIYKDLIKKYSPGTPRAKQSESEKFLLKANELAMKQEPHLQTHWTHAPKLPDLHDQMEMSEYSLLLSPFVSFEH